MENKNEIKLDGETYILKSSIGKSDGKVDRFDFETANKLINRMKRIFSLSEEPVSEDYAVLNVPGLTDPANVGFISGKSERAKRLLSYFVDMEINNTKEVPELTYSKAGGANFSIEYIKPFIDILQVTDHQISIKTREDYPITLENKDFLLVLAPRIENGDDNNG